MMCAKFFGILVGGWGEGYPPGSGDLVIARDRVIEDLSIPGVPFRKSLRILVEAEGVGIPEDRVI
jgi:hypothetical protein